MSTKTSIRLTSSRAEWVVSATSGALGVVFLFAAASKAANPAGVRNVLSYLFALPEAANLASLSSLIAVEVALGVMLVSRWRPRLSLSAALGALLCFTVIVARLMTDTAAPKCGCTGESLLQLNSTVSNGVALARNLFLIGLTVLGLSATLAASSAESAARTESALGN